jgi:hypothetical protein
VVVGEPRTIYLHLVALETDTETVITDGLDEARDKIALLEKIIKVRAYSTGVNTGPRGGSIHFLEWRLGRPVQWRM